MVRAGGSPDAGNDDQLPLRCALLTKQQGQIENELVELQKQHNDSLATYVVRPWGVLSKGKTVMSAVASVGFSIRVDELAAAVVDIALRGNGSQIADNAVLVRQGKQILKLQPKIV